MACIHIIHAIRLLLIGIMYMTLLWYTSIPPTPSSLSDVFEASLLEMAEIPKATIGVNLLPKAMK